MLSLLFYKAIDTVFSGVSIPAIIILLIAVLIFVFNIYVCFSISYYRSLLLFAILSTFLIGYITGFKTIKLPYVSIL